MLLFMDGQGHYDTAGLPAKYSAVSTPSGVTWSVVAEGRFGNCIKKASSSQSFTNGYLAVAPLTTRLSSWLAIRPSGVCGFAVKVDDLRRLRSQTIVIPDGRGEFLAVMEGAICHVGVVLNPDGTFSLWRSRPGSDTDLLATSAEGLQSGAWAYVEFKWLIDAVTGNFQIRANGVEILNFTGNTQDSAALDSVGVWSAVHVLGVACESSAQPITLRMCDLYLADLTSAAPDDVDDFLGDGTVSTIIPNGPGDMAGWSPTPAPNWDAVNDRPAPDGDTTYVQGTAPGTADRYHFEDVPPGSEIKGVHLNILARKLTEGASTLAPTVNATLGPAQGVTSLIYDRYLTQAWDLNPATGAKFTAAELNAAQFGMQKTT